MFHVNKGVGYFLLFAFEFYQARQLYRAMLLEKKRNQAASIINAYFKGWKVNMLVNGSAIFPSASVRVNGPADLSEIFPIFDIISLITGDQLLAGKGREHKVVKGIFFGGYIRNLQYLMWLDELRPGQVFSFFSFLTLLKIC